MECLSKIIELSCDDIAVCGSNCIGGGNGLINMETDMEGNLVNSRVIPVNNFGENFLQFSVCAKGVNSVMRNRYSTISMDRCDDSSFKVCPYWIPPKTFTALAIPANASYIKMERCVYVEERSDDDDDSPTSSPTSTVDDDVNASDAFVAACLTDPKPVEYYGTRMLWPSTIDVEYSGHAYCSKDEHCDGSYCDKNYAPSKCAPKKLDQFTRTPDDYYRED